MPATPPELQWVRTAPGGPRWLASLPDLAAQASHRWGLRLGPDPLPGGRTSLVRPAVRRDGTRAVLKIQFPDRESEHEAAALARWGGDGAARLLAHDPDRRLLLVERCEPGTPLHALDPDAALGILAGLIPRLWVPAGGPFISLAAEAARWAEGLPATWHAAGRPFERRLLDAAVEALRALGPAQGDQVLVHQDLHAGNVLRATREPWLVIDPKPLLGEREFTVVAAVRGRELGSGPRTLRHRLDRLTADLGLDRQRVRGWVLGQTLAWGFQDGSALPHQVETARWALEA